MKKPLSWNGWYLFTVTYHVTYSNSTYWVVFIYILYIKRLSLGSLSLQKCVCLCESQVLYQQTSLRREEKTHTVYNLHICKYISYLIPILHTTHIVTHTSLHLHFHAFHSFHCIIYTQLVLLHIVNININYILFWISYQTLFLLLFITKG